MFKLKNKNSNPSVVRAFSIGEVMISVFILGVTMVTILSLYSKGLREFQDERDSIVASLLAQEGVELARNIRDNNWADRTCALCTSPDTFDNFHSSDNANCRADKDSSNLTDCNSGVNHKKLYINGSGFYVHDSSGTTGTKFRRRIMLDYINSDKELIVTSLVSWNNAGPPTTTTSCNVGNKCVFSQTTLSDWGTGT